MKTSFRRLLALAIVALMAIPVSAQRGSVGLGVYAGYYGSSIKFDYETRFVNGGEAGIMLPIQITNKFRLTPSLSYVFEGPTGKLDSNHIPTGPYDDQAKMNNLSIGFVNLEANYLFNAKRLRPYLLFGAGCGYYNVDWESWRSAKVPQSSGEEEYYYQKNKLSKDNLAYRAYIGVGTDFRLSRKNVLQIALKLGIQSPYAIDITFMDEYSYKPNFFAGLNIGYFFNFK